MIIVDTHCHAGMTKYEPVESLLRHMETSGVDQAVLIQYMGNTDNEYLADCLARFPGKLAAAMIEGSSTASGTNRSTPLMRTFVTTPIGSS